MERIFEEDREQNQLRDVAVAANAASMMTPRAVDDSFLRWSQDFEAKLDSLRKNWLGYVLEWDAQQKRNVWVYYEDRRLMNERGVDRLIGFLRGFTGPNTYMSNLSEARIDEICLLTSKKIAKELLYRAKDYELDLASYETLCVELDNILELALRRAMDEGERNFARGTLLEHVNRGMGQDRKRSLFPSWFPVLGGR